MEVRIESLGALKVAYLSGESDSDGQFLKETLDELVAGSGTATAVDLSALKTINSSGLSALIHLVTRSRLAGGQVFVINPAPYVREVMEITRLDKLFDICATLEEARNRLTQS